MPRGQGLHPQAAAGRQFTPPPRPTLGAGMVARYTANPQLTGSAKRVVSPEFGLSTPEQA